MVILMAETKSEGSLTVFLLVQTNSEDSLMVTLTAETKSEGSLIPFLIVKTKNEGPLGIFNGQNKKWRQSDCAFKQWKLKVKAAWLRF